MKKPKTNTSDILKCIVKMYELKHIYIWLWHVFICVSFLHFQTMYLLLICFNKHIYFKHNIFEICLRESAKCKMTAHTGRKYNVFVKLWTLHCILLPTPRLKLRPLLRSLCLINSFYKRCISRKYNVFNIYIYIYISIFSTYFMYTNTLCH